MCVWEQADELSSQQARSESEMAAVGKCKHLVLRSQAAHHHMQEVGSCTL